MVDDDGRKPASGPRTGAQSRPDFPKQLMIWDAKSTGTLSNVIELLTRDKKSVVFVNKAKAFRNVGNVKQLEELLGFMSEHARKKADDKIGLLNRIESLKSAKAQARMFA